MENKELNLNEMENVSGGTGGSNTLCPTRTAAMSTGLKADHPEPHCRPVEHHR